MTSESFKKKKREREIKPSGNKKQEKIRFSLTTG